MSSMMMRKKSAVPKRSRQRIGNGNHQGKRTTSLLPSSSSSSNKQQLSRSNRGSCSIIKLMFLCLTTSLIGGLFVLHSQVATQGKQRSGSSSQSKTWDDSRVLAQLKQKDEADKLVENSLRGNTRNRRQESFKCDSRNKDDGENGGCGKHGACLVDECICEAGWMGPYCDVVYEQNDLNCIRNPKSDVCMNTLDYGRWKVMSEVRKDEAQDCEKDYWKNNGGAPERNREQVHGLNKFRDLPTDLGEVLEVGAGPYTKTRLILEQSKQHNLKHVTFVDPLMRDYIANKQINTSFDKKNNFNLCVHNKCHETTIINVQAEDRGLPKAHYDTAILVNTLEHVSNAIEVMDNMFYSLKPGGILVFAETFANDISLRSDDKCHPIQPTKKLLELYLSKFTGETILKPAPGERFVHDASASMKRTLFAILRKER